MTIDQVAKVANRLSTSFIGDGSWNGGVNRIKNGVERGG